METDKAKQEAILRAKQSNAKSTQSQEQLLNMQKHTHQTDNPTEYPQTAPLNESHHNLMQSWHNLQDMDYTLAEKGTLDLDGNTTDDKK